jgi:hypothetical protein
MGLASLTPTAVKRSVLYRKLLHWYYSPRTHLDTYNLISRIGNDSPNQWVRHSSQIDGWLFKGEHDFLYELAALPGTGDILEIGCWQGKSTCLMAGACIDHALPSKILCVDSFLMDGTPWQATYHRKLVRGKGTFYEFQQNAARHGYSDRLVILAGLSHAILPYLQATLKLAFLDGAHDCDSVTQDINLVKPMLAEGAIIALHDSTSGWPGVRLAIDAALASDPQFCFYKKVNTLECWQKRPSSEQSSDHLPTIGTTTETVIKLCEQTT